MMRNVLPYLMLLVLLQYGFCQSPAHQLAYEEAFFELDRMARGTAPYRFKEAVFAVENAFHGDSLSKAWFDREIEQLTNLSQSLNLQLDIKDYPDKARMELAGKIYYALIRKSEMKISEEEKIYLEPYTYDFEDIWGEKDWNQMFVYKLLKTHKGNCHSLPYLYKIIADELGVPAYLAFAPNHIYIKQYFQQNGWYNTELTNPSFPTDAWLMVSGYTHIDAIRNGIYLDTLGQKGTLAQCFVDLAKGYERQFPTQVGFRKKCIQKALELHPKNINALLMQAEADLQHFQYAVKLKGYEMNDWQGDEEIHGMFARIEQQYAYIHLSGYRQMPKDMYLDWLGKLETEKNKYTNKKVTDNHKTNQTTPK
ncbi:MAG: hypothetical protein AAF693_12925 [Bacteroidota bacterium]